MKIGIFLFLSFIHVNITLAQEPDWTFLKGYGHLPRYGTFGTQGVAAETNTPGARASAAHWESGGKFYLFGGMDSGTMGANVLCDLWEFDPTTNNWRWLKGNKLVREPAVYGTQGVASEANTPGGRADAITWENNGKLYLYGGTDKDAKAINDLWEFDPSTNNWRWLKGGGASSNQVATYGTQGVAEEENTPGARIWSVSWVNGGKLYLYGGYGNGQYQTSWQLSDLWEYDPSTNNWRWLNGSKLYNQQPVYGSQGIAADANIPGARAFSMGWESKDKLYLFGGSSYSSSYKNDLWEYDISSNTWRWLKGNTTSSAAGIYGIKGTAEEGNTPGGREFAMSWESGDKFYLFGGVRYKGAMSSEVYDDLWEYDPATNNWRWLKGSSSIGAPSVYGTIGIAGEENTPGAGGGSASGWEKDGRLYLFGTSKVKNDLWEYSLGTGNWRWIKGINYNYQPGIYGTLGVPAEENTPGARSGAVSWEIGGKFYLFGGIGYVDNAGTTRHQGFLNDLWEYDPATRQWRWLKGSNLVYQPGKYGTKEVSSEDNTPGARKRALGWESNGKLYLFGGNGIGEAVSESGYRGLLNDLWEYDPSTNKWRWLKGSKQTDQSATYGKIGIAAEANVPGARKDAVAWMSENKLYLFGGEITDTKSYANDLWEYDPTTNNWRWIKGRAPESYGVKGLASPTTVPGPRGVSMGWTAGNKLYLFGGARNHPYNSGSLHYLNELWEFDLTTNNWRWLKGGDNYIDDSAYGVKGIASITNDPGPRLGGISWESNGNFYLLGGAVYQNFTLEYSNDLWEYNPKNNKWRWVKGSDTSGQLGWYKDKEVPAQENNPGSRGYGASWELQGKLYLFGGEGLGIDGEYDDRGDLWGTDITVLPQIEVPDAPIVTGTTRCGAGSITLKAEGAANGNYRWYTTFTGANAIASATNAIYTIPSLSSSKTYFVSIIDLLGVESARVPVTATIIQAPSAPGASTNISLCQGLSANPLSATGSNLKWYTVATGDIASSEAPIPNTTVLGVTEYWVTQTATNGCESSRTKITVTITPPKTIYAGPAQSVCKNQSSFSLIGSNPTGGVWSGSGVTSAGIFNPSAAGVGDHILTYTVSENGCLATATKIVSVISEISTSGTIVGQSKICIGIENFTYSVNSVAGATSYNWTVPTGFTVVSGQGTTTVVVATGTIGGEMAVTASNSCGTSLASKLPITVYPSPVVQAGPDQVFCMNTTALALTEFSPAGGTWTGLGVSAEGIFNPVVAGVGAHTLTYTVVQNGCTNFASKTVTVTALPFVSFTSVANTVCSSSSNLLLTGGQPVGGVYSGPGVNDGVFNALIAGIGTHTITYTYISGGCSVSSTQQFTVATCTGIDKDPIASSIQLFPNPTTGSLSVKAPVAGKSNVKVMILDLHGKVVIERNYNQVIGEFKEEFDLKALSKGIYLLNLVLDNSIVARRIVLH